MDSNVQKNAESVSLLDTMVCWSPGEPVRLVRWPDPDRLRRPLSFGVGACDREVRAMGFADRKTWVFITAVQLMVGYACSPADVHAALLGLDEYVDGLADDIPGVAERRREQRNG